MGLLRGDTRSLDYSSQNPSVHCIVHVVDSPFVGQYPLKTVNLTPQTPLPLFLFPATRNRTMGAF